MTASDTAPRLTECCQCWNGMLYVEFALGLRARRNVVQRQLFLAPGGRLVTA